MKRTLGRVLSKRGLGLGMVAGAGMAVASHNPLENLTNASMEFVFNTPDADNLIMGRDIGFGELLGLPDFSDYMNPLPDKWNPAKWMEGINIARNNPTVRGMAFASYKDNRDRAVATALRHVDDGYTTYPYNGSIFPYQPRTKRQGIAASGDVVFGMYNSRMQ